MKKVISFLLALSLVLVLCACGGSSGPDPKDYTPEDIINGLSSAGCSVGDITAYTAETDPNQKLGRPNEYTGKADFEIPGIETINTATVETFANKADCKSRYDYLNQYMYKSDYAILRIPYEVTPEDAGTYETAFHSFVGS